MPGDSCFPGNIQYVTQSMLPVTPDKAVISEKGVRPSSVSLIMSFIFQPWGQIL